MGSLGRLDLLAVPGQALDLLGSEDLNLRSVDRVTLDFKSVAIFLHGTDKVGTLDEYYKEVSILQTICRGELSIPVSLAGAKGFSVRVGAQKR